MSTLPRTNQTTLNYDWIPTSPMEQRKPLRKGGLCWDGTFVLGEHVACLASAEWNGNRQGGVAVAVVAVPGLPPGGGLWSLGMARDFVASCC